MLGYPTEKAPGVGYASYDAGNLNIESLISQDARLRQARCYQQAANIIVGEVMPAATGLAFEGHPATIYNFDRNAPKPKAVQPCPRWR
jgi:hypothetical protein